MCESPAFGGTCTGLSTRTAGFSTCSCRGAGTDGLRKGSSRRLRDHGEPLEIVTDKALVLTSVIADLVPEAEDCTDQYANNRIKCDHGRLKARLRPMRGLKTDRTASVVTCGHSFVQNIRRGHYQLDHDTDPNTRLEAAFSELRSSDDHDNAAKRGRVATPSNATVPVQRSPVSALAVRQITSAAKVARRPHQRNRAPITLSTVP